MMKRIIRGHLIITFIFFFLHLPLLVLSQPDKSVSQLETEAKKHLESGRYHLALDLYLKLDSVQPNKPDYLFAIGVAYLNTAYQEEKALSYFERCLKSPEQYSVSLNYYLGKAYHLSHKMDEAIFYLNLYLNYLKSNERKNKSKIEELERDIEMCKNGMELMARPLDLDIINMGPEVNSIYPDYAAVLSADQKELIFTSCRPNTTGCIMDPLDGRYHEDLYISFHSDSGWTAPVNMGDSVNTEGHDASLALSADGQILYLYRYNPDPKNFTSGDIYISKLNGNTWGNAQRVSSNVNSTIYHEPGASISSDGRILFFASDRPGGYGGMDIYMVKMLPTGEWAIPVNVGSKINTNYDEDFPFIHSDGKTLYFSSRGHKTMGGFDVFKSEYDEEKLEWSDPVNVGYPINTAHDDIHFTWSPDGKKIYFSSIREDSYGDQDIYYAVVHKETSTEVLVMKGFLQDSLDLHPVHGRITVTNNKTKELTGIYNSNSMTGKYLIVLPEGHFTMRIEAENHAPCEQLINIIELEGFVEKERDIILCPSMISIK